MLLNYFCYLNVFAYGRVHFLQCRVVNKLEKLRSTITNDDNEFPLSLI